MTLLINSSSQLPDYPPQLVAPTRITPAQISVIIPVKNNQAGVNQLCQKLRETHSLEMMPREVIIVDNNSNPEIVIPPEWQSGQLRIVLTNCSIPGAGAARNAGAAIATGEWLLFTDSDCIPTPSFISGYFNHLNGAVGYVGQVSSLNQDWLSSYYQTQEIFQPPGVLKGETIYPQYLITANALIWRKAFELCGGFNQSFPSAAGEDVDLSFRLWQLGTLSYAPSSTILHDYSDGLGGFIRRFVRYGRGNRLVSKLHNITFMPPPFSPNVPTLTNFCLAKLQYGCLALGYFILSPVE